MKIFLKRSIFYLLPLLVVIVIISAIDVYSLFSKNATLGSNKYNIGYSFDQGRRYKIFSFLNNPSKKIILGASEINLINENNLPDDDWHSLSFGGVSLNETIDLFWKIVEDHEINEIILAPEFIKYYHASKGEIYSWNNSQSNVVFNIYSNKAEYYLDKNVIRSTFFYILNCLGIQNKISRPDMSKEEFWDSQLSYVANLFSEEISEEENTRIIEKLSLIGNYCRENNIKVRIVIPMQHWDIIKLEYSPEIFPIYKDYLNKLVEIFDYIYYFDYPNNISINKDNFSDPLHCFDADIYINSIWGESTNCIILDNKNIVNTLDSIKIICEGE